MKNFLVSLLLLIALTACNLPGNGIATPTEPAPDAVYTQMAQTVAAELTRVAVQASPTSNIPTPTYTPSPSVTPIPTKTNTSQPCLLVGYTSATIDVTIPDNTVMAPGQAFVKTWRFTNAGTCSWNSSFQLVFDHGDSLGVSNTYSQPLTSGTVAPGQTVDVSVNLTAPAAPGAYTGYWRFRDNNGVYFGIGGTSPWVVKIKVVNTTTITILPVFSESGIVMGDGFVGNSGMIGMGDNNLNFGIQMFMSYNISGIPVGATITEVKLDMRNFTIQGDPFAGLGALNLYKQDFATLDVSDFVSLFPSGGNLADWGSTTALNTLEASPEIKTALQKQLGTARFQLRFQFVNLSDGDNTIDTIFYTPSGSALNNPALIVVYTTP